MAQVMEMSKKSIDEYTQKLRERYSRMTGRQARGIILDEYIGFIRFERKYAIKVLTGFPHIVFATAKRRAQATIQSLRKSLIRGHSQCVRSNESV